MYEARWYVGPPVDSFSAFKTTQNFLKSMWKSRRKQLAAAKAMKAIMPLQVNIATMNTSAELWKGFVYDLFGCVYAETMSPGDR